MISTALQWIGGFTLGCWVIVGASWAWTAWHRKPSLRDRLPNALPQYAAHMVRDETAIRRLPTQRRYVGHVDADRFIAELYPCGALNERCRLHASNPDLCTDETPCCSSCPDRRPPAA